MRPEAPEDAARTSPTPQASPVPSGAGKSPASPLGGNTSLGRAAPEPSNPRTEDVITQNIGTTKGRFRNGLCISSQNGGNFRALLQLNLRGIEVLSHFAIRVRQCELE
jgi:hypothetical protein